MTKIKNVVLVHGAFAQTAFELLGRALTRRPDALGAAPCAR